jgi:hypothetical protein
MISWMEHIAKHQDVFTKGYRFLPHREVIAEGRSGMIP